MSTLRAAVSGIRKVIALPFWLISGIAFLLLGIQLLLALANVLNGVSIADALLIWVGNTIILVIVAFVAGGLALLISGTPSEAVAALNEGALKSDEVPPPMRTLAANGSGDGGEPGAPAERLEDGRLLFGPNAGEVLRVLDGLQRAEPNVWMSVGGAHMAAYGDTARAARVTLLVEQGARSGISRGAITAEDVSAAETLAAKAAARVIPLVIAEARSKSPVLPFEQFELAVADYLQTAAASLVAFVVVRPFLEPGEFEELWAPYAAVAPLSPSPDRRSVRDMDAERHAWVVAHKTQPTVANRSEIQPGDNDRLSEEVRALWPKVVDAVVAEWNGYRPIIESAQFGGVEGNIVVLAFPPKMRFLCESGERKAERLAETMSLALGRSVAVECRVAESPPPKS